MFAFALSSVLTGLVFFALGALKLGSLSEFFPRHILVGCIGGVGFFLFITGMEISARIDEETGIDSGIIRHLFDNEILPLWVSDCSSLHSSISILTTSEERTDGATGPSYFPSIYHYPIPSSPHLPWLFPRDPRRILCNHVKSWCVR